MTTEEIALRLVEAQLKGGKPLSEVKIREAFAVAHAFEEEARSARAHRSRFRPEPNLALDDNGL